MSNDIIVKTLKKQNKDAILYLQSGNYKEALKIFKSSYEIEKSLNLEQQYAQTQMNIVNTLMILGKNDEALENALEGSEILKKYGTNNYLSSQLVVANLYIIKKKYTSALEILNRLVTSRNEEIINKSNLLLFKVYVYLKDYSKAQDCITKSIVYSERKKEYKELVGALNLRSKLFKTKGRNDLAVVDKMRAERILTQI